MTQDVKEFPFPINTEAGSKNPEFIKILQKLSLSISDDLSLIAVSNELNNTHATLTREKKRFMEKRKLLNICTSFSYHNSSQSEIVSQGLALSNLERMIPVKHCGKELPLAGITKDDLKAISDQIGVKSCQQILTPQIEADLHKTKETLCDFISPGKPLPSLASAVENKIHGNQMRTRKLHYLTSEEVSLSTLYIKKSGEVLDLYRNFSKEETIQTEKERHIEKVAYLSARCSKITLMMENLEARLLIDTYSKDKVLALKQISYHIKKRKQNLETEKANHQHTLDAYLSLGEDFVRLVDKYSAKQNLLENNIWALQNLG